MNSLYFMALSFIVGDPDQAPPIPQEQSSYEKAHNDAVRLKKPLVITIGNIDIRKISGTVWCWLPSINDDDTPRIIVVNPPNLRGLAYRSDEEIVISRGANPFRKGEIKIAEDEEPWLASVAKPKGTVRYLPTLLTQEIAVTNDRDRITPVSKFNLPTKWHVPGGLDGVEGWSSTLYKYIPKDASDNHHIGNILVVNGIPNGRGGFFTQQNRGHKRSYPVGTIFTDVLSNANGEVIEHREWEKINDYGEIKWIPGVYRTNAQRPEGFPKIKSNQCITCHSEAGTGGYATGLIPGGDNILSDPFPGL